MKKGSHLTYETRKKISEAQIGRKQSEETKKKRSESLKGRIPWNKGKTNTYRHTEEWKEKTRKRMLGKKMSEETKRKLSILNKGKLPWNTGKHRSEETKNKLSIYRKGKRYSKRTEFKKGNISWIKGNHHSDITKQKIRIKRLEQIMPTEDTVIEKKIQDELNRRCILYEKHINVCDVCQPDIIFSPQKIAVFCDGDYWHNKSFKDGLQWEKDRNQDKVLKENNWKIIRFWESEIINDTKNCVDVIEALLC